MTSMARGLLLFTAVLLSGCVSSDMDDLKKWMASIGPDSKSKIEPLPVLQKPDTFEYNDEGLENPFKQRSIEQVAGASGASGAPDYNRPKEPLEEFPLDALRFVGSLEKRGTRYALIRSPDGALHRVSKGHHIGQNYGEIISIDPEAGLEIKETIQDANGAWNESTAMLSPK